MLKVDLSGKIAVVTGGGGVLCSTMAKALAKNGAKVAILDLNQDAAEKVATEIKQANGEAIGVQADVLDSNSLKQARQQVNKQLGSCDILVNGAGGNHPKGTTSNEYLNLEDIGKDDVTTFFDLDPKSIEFVFNLNFLGTLLTTQAFAQDMVEKPDTTIVNISSMNAFTPLTKIPAYSAAKAAVSNFTQWLAVHLSKVGVRVNAIAPGFFLTEQNKQLLVNENGEFTPRAHKIISQTPLERFGTPEELLGTLLWLVDNDSSGFVTGTIIPIDGGFSAYSGV